MLFFDKKPKLREEVKSLFNLIESYLDAGIFPETRYAFDSRIRFNSKTLFKDIYSYFSCNELGKPFIKEIEKAYTKYIKDFQEKEKIYSKQIKNIEAIEVTLEKGINAVRKLQTNSSQKITQTDVDIMDKFLNQITNSYSPMLKKTNDYLLLYITNNGYYYDFNIAINSLWGNLLHLKQNTLTTEVENNMTIIENKITKLFNLINSNTYNEIIRISSELAKNNVLSEFESDMLYLFNFFNDLKIFFSGINNTKPTITRYFIIQYINSLNPDSLENYLRKLINIHTNYQNKYYLINQKIQSSIIELQNSLVEIKAKMLFP